MYKKMCSLTPNFREKRFSCFWGQITHTRKSRFCRCLCPVFKAGLTSRKKYHSESGLNKRDRATGGFVWPSTVRSDEWPTWFSFWFSGCWRALAKGTAWAFFWCNSLSSRAGLLEFIPTGSQRKNLLAGLCPATKKIRAFRSVFDSRKRHFQAPRYAGA